MSAVATVPRRHGDLWLVARQLRYEQLTFWRNPIGAFFTVGFSTIFLLLLAATGGTSRIGFLGGIREIQYYVPGFIAYGLMSACFNMLAIQLVNRRETGLLKRSRLSPLPTWVMLAALFLSALVITLVQVALLLAIGRLAFQLVLPQSWAALAVAIVAGVFCFTALGVAATTLIPNADAAGPVVSIVFFILLFLSGLWYPLTPGSALAETSGWLPVRAMILATFAPFYLRPGVSPWSWHQVLVLVIWGAIGTLVARRRFSWAPRRFK